MRLEEADFRQEPGPEVSRPRLQLFLILNRGERSSGFLHERDQASKPEQRKLCSGTDDPRAGRHPSQRHFEPRADRRSWRSLGRGSESARPGQPAASPGGCRCEARISAIDTRSRRRSMHLRDLRKAPRSASKDAGLRTILHKSLFRVFEFSGEAMAKEWHRADRFSPLVLCVGEGKRGGPGGSPTD